MNFLRKWYFPILCASALMVYGAQRFDLYLPGLINNHFNDFICMPIVLKICQYAIRTVKSNERLQVPLFLQVLLTICYGVYFEFILPLSNDRYTSDPLDIVAYFSGLVCYQWIEKSGIFKLRIAME
ncbi:hypothetical protein FGM00_11670 [Aggregatimonas sangjinii]|uniref:VanZ family protein n=1 Tax=Aggregatimonas sangjinii TaxID=2583587 RepID=A0A5B7SUC4_9FLAO|nr:hypothetical protein [Aggregatimonas sangjinii]QCX00733.1 hypothetical protein FGM00_11670 [Aggregatimonas sangjinii]